MAIQEGFDLANVVSRGFVSKYFQNLGQTPHEAYRAYVDSSVVSRPGPDGIMMSFTSVKAINEYIISCDYKNTKIEVLSVDSQNSLENGVFVMVTGFLTGKDNIKKKFIQTFYLAFQNNAYVVINDILRYVDEKTPNAIITSAIVESGTLPMNNVNTQKQVVLETKTAKPTDELNKNKLISKTNGNAVEKTVVPKETTPICNKKIDKKVVTTQKQAETKTAKPADELNKNKLITKTYGNYAVEKGVVPKETTPVGKVEENIGTKTAKPVDEVNKNKPISKRNDNVVEKVGVAQKQTEPVAERVVPQLKIAKRSFVAIVQSMATNAAPIKVKAPIQKPKSTATTLDSEKQNVEKIIEEQGTSIYVANLPMNAMPSQLHEIFKDFGPIKENGIQVRSSRAHGTCFGFIAFKSASSVQSVLQAAKDNFFMLANHKLHVHEKKNVQKIIEEPDTSIFVANLPLDAMPSELEKLFKEFGPIKENGIQIRSYKADGTCFGFVSFESATSVQNVLQATKNYYFMLGDRTLRIQEKIKQDEYNRSKPLGRLAGEKMTQSNFAVGGNELRGNKKQ